jgi:uncharacterized Ntn-hydrolase superfamily protein
MRRNLQDAPVTYSVVAQDPDTGAFGVAVQSHFFSTGAVVPWVEAGVGAVATQAFSELSYGSLGLELMRTGDSSGEALRALVAADPGQATRQVAMIDSTGRAAAHTGIYGHFHRLSRRAQARSCQNYGNECAESF